MAEQPSDTIPAPSGWIPAVPCAPSDKPSDYVFRQGDFTGIDAEFPELDEPLAKLCTSCSKPERPILATHGPLCAYCCFRNGRDDYLDTPSVQVFDNQVANAEARARLEAADRKARPRATAESKMLAEGERYATKVYPVVEDFE